MKWSNIKEDISTGYAPKEISFMGYTTKNLHHSADATKAFQATIDKAQRGEIRDSVGVLHALKATDTYMKINDMHLAQGKAPDEAELQQWIKAHNEARNHLHKIGEFMHHMDYWHMHEHELQDMETQYNPETAGAEMADSYEPQGDLVEELTDKTIKQSDRVKVARVIADMLGVEKAESMSPDQAVNTGLRLVKTKRMTPEMVGILRKMLHLATEVGIKVDKNLVPKTVAEEAVESDVEIEDTDSPGIVNFKNFLKMTKVGHSIHPDKPGTEDDQVRRRKVMYKTEEVELEVRKGMNISDKVEEGLEQDAHKMALEKLQKALKNPNIPAEKKAEIAKQIQYQRSQLQKGLAEEAKATYCARCGTTHVPPSQGGTCPALKEEAQDEVEDLSDDELDKMADDVDHEDHILDLYDPEELAIVDADSGEEVEDDEDGEEVNEEALNEVLSRAERMKARIRFMRTKAKRQRRLQIVLKRRSDVKTINKRSRRLAIKLIKQRLVKKPLAKMSVSEKERVERMIQQRKGLIDRLAMRLAPRVRRIESDRLSHKHTTQPAPAAGM